MRPHWPSLLIGSLLGLLVGLLLGGGPDGDAPAAPAAPEALTPPPPEVQAALAQAREDCPALSQLTWVVDCGEAPCLLWAHGAGSAAMDALGACLTWPYESAVTGLTVLPGGDAVLFTDLLPPNTTLAEPEVYEAAVLRRQERLGPVATEALLVGG
ncbi:hypothetical protein L6R49_11705 [Myxococcota bacterium]|nr:hypothetical protein [Myxococcota bacterium]